MNESFKVFWSQTALEELTKIRAYPDNVKERIYLDSINRMAYSPTLTAHQISKGLLEGYWVRLGLFQVILVFEVDEVELTVWIDGVKHKRENVYWKR